VARGDLKTRTGWAATFVGLAAAIAGCGGGGSTSVPANASPGQKVFAQASCGSCHTLKAAGTNGTVGPDLDGKHLSAATVTHYVQDGGGGMPSFSSTLSATQIQQLATFVANASQ
jgi:mono/diheme cytochrome c family protein